MRKLAYLSILFLYLSVDIRAAKQFPAAPGENTTSDELIVRLNAGADVNSVLSLLVPQAVAISLSKHINLYLLKLPPGLQQILFAQLAAHPLVQYVEPNRIRHVTVGAPNDPNYSSQWDLQTIQAVQAWSLLPDRYLTAATAGTNRIKVAVLDTGADCTHPDFANSGGTSADSAQGGQFLFSLSQALVVTTIASPKCSWQDDNGHGTHTAGTVAAATQNGAGVASVGYPLQVIVFKVLDQSGSGSDSTIAAAIEAAADAGAQVISMSLGGAGYSQALQDAVNYAWQRNSLVVAAAGNSNSSALFFPAGANHAIGVAATDSTNARASFSNFGNAVDIAAPGVNILSTLPTYPNPMGVTSYGWLSGTSMATPHVAAVAGLVALGNPGLSVDGIAQRLQQSAQSSIGGGGWSQYLGYGILNAAQAVSGSLRPATLGSLVGQVVDSSNLPINGASITAGGQSFATAADGLFRIANLASGDYFTTVTASGYPAANLKFTVISGADTTVTVQMGVSLGNFTGAVTINGLPAAGATVAASSGGLIRGTAVTNGSGSYTLFLPAGTYDLSVSAAGDIRSSSLGHALGFGAPTVVNLTISREGNITGVVQNSSGTRLAGAHVDVTGSGFSVGATTDSTGNFSTGGVPAGTYTVTGSADGYSNLTLTGINVSPNVFTPVTLQLTALSSQTGPIGYWNFDEGSGSIAHDTSGSGYNGTVNGATWTAGKTNGALSFNGSANNVVTPNIALGNAFSVSAWVNPAVGKQAAYVRIAETRFDGGLYVGADGSGTKYKFIVNAGAGSTGGCGAGYGCAEGGTITSGWHLVTATYDGATGKLYVDGAVVASDTFTAPANTAFPLYVGAYYGGGYGWNGAVDEVRLYNRALTSTEVSALYGPTGSGGPIGLWNFDEGTGGIAHDTSGSGYNGTVNGATWTAGKTNGALSFNGSTNNVVTPNIALGSAFSVSAWVNPAVGKQAAYVRIAETRYNGGLYVGTDASGTKYKFIVNTGAGSTGGCGAGYGCAEGGTITSGWHLVTATYDGATGKLYVDGAVVASDTFTAPSNTTFPLYVGAYYGGGYGWNGAVDEVRLYNRALASTEVSALYGSTGSGGPIGLWNFDEGTGGIAHDTSGSGYNGTVNGATWTAGKINGALSFNGSTNNVVTPNIALGSTFSVSAWVNPAVANQGAFVRIAETRYNGGLYVGTDASGTKYKFIVNTGAGSTGGCGALFGCAAGGTITSGWHLVTATYDGATGKLYVDGAVVASDTFSAPANTAFPLYVGAYYGGGYGWHGAVDEVRLYNRALTSTEVTAIYTGG